MAKGKYRPWLTAEGLERLAEMAARLTDTEMAREMGISSSTYYDWLGKYPQMSECISGARAGAQAAHLRGQAAVQQGVQPPVIAEGRVHKEVGIPVAEEADHLQHHLHLRPRRKISRIERVKMQAQRFDMPRDGQKLAAQVEVGIAREFARVGAQQRRGHHGGIHPRGA